MELTREQRDKALVWRGSLTEASIILNMPWRRCWAYVSGKPVSIRPLSKSKEARAKMPALVRKAIKPGQYCIIELQKLRLADLLVPVLRPQYVQEVLDVKLTQSLTNLPTHERLGAWIVVVDDRVSDPYVQAFGAGQELYEAVMAARAIGACTITLNLEAIFLEILGRVCAFQEHREYVYKSPGSRVAEALTRIRKENLAKGLPAAALPKNR